MDALFASQPIVHRFTTMVSCFPSPRWQIYACPADLLRCDKRQRPIPECTLAPFTGGSTSQRIPFVFLPLKGQIVHPSKEISLNGIEKPICFVSGAKYLTEDGWIDLRNPQAADIPFRLFRDEGRTYIRWEGEKALQNRMSGRTILVHLLCREIPIDMSSSPTQEVFMPCVAFRIVGSPTKLQNNMTEVAFSLEAHSTPEHRDGDSLSVSEYVAIGISSVLLGLIYVASVFLYLHLKKRSSSKTTDQSQSDTNIAAMEEGIVKNNPLLSITHHFGLSENAYSDSTNSDNDIPPDLIKHHEAQITSALIHAQRPRYESYTKSYSSTSSSDNSYQDNSSFERLPEEDVSIVETLDERSEGTKSLTGTVRKKLYFNPSYFEPHLLVAPPPAALEFLSKIREVIAIAKQKMATKRFAPTLFNIPEEETQYSVDPSYDFSRPSSRTSRRGSIISLKRENSRRKTCSGCPGCVPSEYARGGFAQLPMLAACQNCTITTTTESKQRSIRKWLEDIPLLKLDENSNVLQSDTSKSPNRVRSPTRSLPPESISSDRALSPRPASEQGVSSKKTHQNKRGKEKTVRKLKLPPPPAPPSLKMKEEEFYETLPDDVGRGHPLPPPDMIQEAMVMENQTEETRIPTLTKNQMKAVINELTVHKTMLEAANRVLARKMNNGYETDSLERTTNKGYSTPSDYAEVSSSQPSPSLSTALPVDEEITMQNAIFNKNTGSMTLSKLNMDLFNENEHDYELIVMKRGSTINGDLYKFPELLQNNNGYSLVSEVYVNNGYNYGSNPSTPSGSNCSTLEKRKLKIRYDGGSEKPGKLLIEVEDCMDHYIPINDSDEFEPDTLDRPNKYGDKKNVFEDSLERPNQILLRTNGTFKPELSNVSADVSETSNFNREFGSLREMFEEKRKQAREKEQFNMETGDTDSEGRLLTLEERHLRRQRVKTTSTGTVVPPDVIPPPPHDGSPIYEHPKPPRKVTMTPGNYQGALVPKTTFGSKNVDDRSAGDTQKTSSEVGTPGENVQYQLCVLQKSKTGNITNLIQTDDIILTKNHQNQFVLHSKLEECGVARPLRTLRSFKTDKGGPLEVYLKRKNERRAWDGTLKPEDSGYLSTDSSELRVKNHRPQTEGNGSETDESLGDGQSESGAESVETHSVWFSRMPTRNYSISVDSGLINNDDETSSSDSETVSYTTVVPVSSNPLLRN
ncbi:hypothetical protein GWI33_009119 [Rhynchophorus ferrugineus]|uniref:Uncharacterized protein n=1 Tax=Rhynchophorus ferrugineus TaxID=354439 RepID=A0A834IB98_RHYFE|nr:hypothetical protein GWI33_009119 [Rhynchophorus ferrugineus]